MFKLVEGFNPKCSNEEYHGDREYKSSSALKMILKDPRKFHKVYVMNEKEEMNSDALSIGSYVHTRILEPHLVDEEYAIFTGSSRRGDTWNTFKEENKDKVILTSSQKSLADKMIDNFNEAHVTLGNHGNEKDVLISSFFKDGFAEETLAGHILGYKVKTRFDYRKEFDDFGSINDLKTTNIALGGATLEEVEDICTYWNYDLSAALYVDLVSQCTGKQHDFYFIFLSKKDFQTRIFKASDRMIQRGRAMYKEAIYKLKEAEKTGIYFENKIEELR